MFMLSVASKRAGRRDATGVDNGKNYRRLRVPAKRIALATPTPVEKNEPRHPRLDNNMVCRSMFPCHVRIYVCLSVYETIDKKKTTDVKLTELARELRGHHFSRPWLYACVFGASHG